MGVPAIKRALIIRHHAAETLASNFTSELADQGFELTPLHLFESAPTFSRFDAPPLEEVSLIVALGGPMSANDDLPALHEETEYLKDAMNIGVPVLGVCLGAQIMSTALGGIVEPTGGHQFGLRKISITKEGSSDPIFNKIRVPLVPTLHGDCFSVPDGATKLAEGYILCRDGSYRLINMAFRYRKSYAFQFEPQLTIEELKVWDRVFGDDYKLMGDQFDPEEESVRNLREFDGFAPCHESQMREMLRAFLGNAGLADSV